VEFNLADLWEHVVDALPEREAMVCGERRLTYAQADERANRLAHHWAATGIGPGDHVALYLYNCTEYLEGMLAAFKLRAVPLNVNYRYGAEELRYLLADSDAKAVVFHREFAPKLGRCTIGSRGSGGSSPSTTALARHSARSPASSTSRRWPRPFRSGTSVNAPPTTSTSSIRAGRPACRRA
jgi:acyl-CoA synthetase (AMP-forming)/AMP-acid ligase II